MSSPDTPPPAGSTESMQSPVKLFVGIVVALALVVGLGMCGGGEPPAPSQTEQS